MMSVVLNNDLIRLSDLIRTKEWLNSLLPPGVGGDMKKRCIESLDSEIEYKRRGIPGLVELMETDLAAFSSHDKSQFP